MEARQREIRLQLRILLLLERRFAKRISRAIRLLSDRLIAGYEATRAVPNLGPGDFRALEDVFREMADASIRAFGARILAASEPFTTDGGKSFTPTHGRPDQVKFEDFDALLIRIAAAYLESEMTRQAITNITETTRRAIVDQVQYGDAQGWGTREIARHVRKAVPAIARVRSELIARTETHNAANTGAFQSAQIVGLPMDKEWISTEDNRVRSSHDAMNGVRVPMDEPFRVARSDGGTDMMMHPGDRDGGSAENTINCRCGTGFVRPRS